jgi:hypothetical protein
VDICPSACRCKREGVDTVDAVHRGLGPLGVITHISGAVIVDGNEWAVRLG